MLDVLQEIKAMQDAKYNLIIVPQLRRFLLDLKALDDDTVHARSKELQASRSNKSAGVMLQQQFQPQHRPRILRRSSSANSVPITYE